MCVLNSSTAQARNVRPCQVRSWSMICLTNSHISQGFPMGLSAGFKLIDKDLIKDVVEKERSHPMPKQREKEKEDVPVKHKSVNDSHESLGHQHSGWTSMVEDWLCYAAGTSGPSTSSLVSEPERAYSPTTHTPPSNEHESKTKDDQKGPYQLLTKERLMGIYMAIYIHRDIRAFVQGIHGDSPACLNVDIGYRDVKRSCCRRSDRWSCRQ